MASLRPHTKTYPESARKALGIAVARAREAAGYRARPAFADVTGLSVRSILKLEQGEPVGPSVYEAVARALPGWTADTPRLILEGGPVPDPTPGDDPQSLRTDIPEPEPQDYPDEMEYLNAVYWYLRKTGMSHEAVMRGFNMAAAIYTRRNTERAESDTNGEQLG